MGGGPPGGGGTPTLGDLIEVLQQLPPQLKAAVVEALSKPESAGPPPGMPGGAPSGPQPGDLRKVAAARAGGM